MILQSLLPLACGFIIIAIGLIVVAKSTRSKSHILFFLECLTLFVWLFFYSRMYGAPDKASALQWARLGFLGIALIPIFIYHFYLVFFARASGRIIPLIYCAGIVFLLLSQTPYIYQSIEYYWWGWYPVAGVCYPFFVLFFAACFISALCLLYRSLKPARARSSLEYTQIKYLLAAFFVASFGIVDYIAKFRIALYPFGYLAALGWILIVGYTVIRFRLLDIRVIVTRVTLFLIVYLLVLGIPFGVAISARATLINSFAGQWWMVPLLLMAALATLGPFIYIRLERRAEEALLKEQRKYHQTLKQASVGMTRIRNLQKLLELITHIVTKSVRISFAAVYLFEEHANQYVLHVKRDSGKVSLPDIAMDNYLILKLHERREPLVYEEIKHIALETGDPAAVKVEESMRALNAAVVIPSFLEERLLGLILLGEKLSGAMYTPEDLNVFQILASQAALAIENAQFYEDAKEMQEQISQAEKMATIGTMADGLSHQINNRFYALSLIASDSIDTIRMTDTAACSPEVKEMVESVSKALERIQANVIQGGEVVKGILKYTRKGDEGFEPLTMDQILDGTLDMIQFKIRLSDVDIIRDYAKDAPKIYGNLVQLQEVFFNFIDNAYDAIMERKAALKEEGYRGAITISMNHSQAGSVTLVVADNGMGVKEQNAKKVFTPFFTTKTSSRKGTGLGLYVIRRIITETHKGAISFESRHCQGTRFSVTLPVAG